MSDPIGTVRREHRGDDFSLWQLISTSRDGTRWMCVYSSSTRSNNSEDDPDGFSLKIERFTKVIGAVPGTPAAETVAR